MNVQEEIWKDVVGFEGLYQVSNLGRVKSLFDGNCKIFREKILKPCEHISGYLQVQLCKNGEKKTMKIHRLVAQAFLDNPENLPTINHRDENKENNCVENLEWLSQRDNNNYGSHNKRVAAANKNGKRSKPVLQYTKNGELVREWPSINEAGRNGFQIGHIWSCCLGKRRSHKGYIWRYKV